MKVNKNKNLTRPDISALVVQAELPSVPTPSRLCSPPVFYILIFHLKEKRA